MSIVETVQGVFVENPARWLGVSRRGHRGFAAAKPRVFTRIG